MVLFDMLSAPILVLGRDYNSYSKITVVSSWCLCYINCIILIFIIIIESVWDL